MELYVLLVSIPESTSPKTVGIISDKHLALSEAVGEKNRHVFVTQLDRIGSWEEPDLEDSENYWLVAYGKYLI